MPKHEFTYKANAQVKNGYGFGILTSGIDRTQYDKNPIVLINHGVDAPIGTTKNLSIKGTDVEALIVIDDDNDAGHEKMVRDINKNLYQGMSMGIDLDFSSVQIGVDGFPPELPVFTKSTLAELSICTLPINGECLRLSHKGKIISNEDVRTKLSALSNSNQNTMNKLLLAFVAAFKLSVDTTEEAAIVKLQSVINDYQELETLRAEKKDWEKREGEMKLSRVNELVDGAVDAGKILPAEKQTYVTLATSNFEATKEALDARTPRKSITAQLSKDSADQENDETANWSFKDFMTKKPALLSKMKKEDPERYKKLFNATDWNK